MHSTVDLDPSRQGKSLVDPTETARAGFDGDVLVLLDHSGKELGRLRPAR
jgi:hypothetical protein